MVKCSNEMSALMTTQPRGPPESGAYPGGRLEAQTSFFLSLHNAIRPRGHSRLQHDFFKYGISPGLSEKKL